MKQKEIEQVLMKMGFEKVTENQFRHSSIGYIHLSDFTLSEVAECIFELGKYAKCKEVISVLKIEKILY
jgi:hypothetical protein